MIRFNEADPGMILWKKVWCFYFEWFCGLDLVSGSREAANDANLDVEVMLSAKNDDGGVAIMSTLNNLDVGFDTSDIDEAKAILMLKEFNEKIEDAEIKEVMNWYSKEHSNKNKIILDATSNSLDGKRFWAKVRDLLMEIKLGNHRLWEECCSIGINNCSGWKLESHLETVERFFDLRGKGPSQKIRWKNSRLRLGVMNQFTF